SLTLLILTTFLGHRLYSSTIIAILVLSAGVAPRNLSGGRPVIAYRIIYAVNSAESLVHNFNTHGLGQCLVVFVTVFTKHPLQRPVIMPLVLLVQELKRDLLHLVQQLLAAQLGLLGTVQHRVITTIELAVHQFINDPLQLTARRQHGVTPAKPGQFQKIKAVTIGEGKFLVAVAIADRARYQLLHITADKAHGPLHALQLL